MKKKYYKFVVLYYLAYLLTLRFKKTLGPGNLCNCDLDTNIVLYHATYIHFTHRVALYIFIIYIYDFTRQAIIIISLPYYSIADNIKYH